MLELNYTEIIHLGVQGIPDRTAAVDLVYGWQFLEHEGKRYLFVEGESRNGIVSQNIHDCDLGLLIYCKEVSKEMLERKKKLKEIGIDIDKLTNFGVQEGRKTNDFIDSLISKLEK